MRVGCSDGPSREVSVGPTQVSLKRTTPKNMPCAGRLSGLLIQALRFLGEAHITPERVAHLRSVEDHFDTAYELETELELAGWQGLYAGFVWRGCDRG